MIKMKLYKYGIESTCEEIETLLYSVLNKDCSKKDKDIAMSQVLGMIKTIRIMTLPDYEDVSLPQTETSIKGVTSG